MPRLNTHAEGRGQGGADGKKGHVSEEVILYSCRVCHISTHKCTHACMNFADALGSEQGERSYPGTGGKTGQLVPDDLADKGQSGDQKPCPWSPGECTCAPQERHYTAS